MPSFFIKIKHKLQNLTKQKWGWMSYYKAGPGYTFFTKNDEKINLKEYKQDIVNIVKNEYNKMGKTPNKINFGSKSFYVEAAYDPLPKNWISKDLKVIQKYLQLFTRTKWDLINAQVGVFVQTTKLFDEEAVERIIRKALDKLKIKVWSIHPEPYRVQILRVGIDVFEDEEDEDEDEDEEEDEEEEEKVDLDDKVQAFKSTLDLTVKELNKIQEKFVEKGVWTWGAGESDDGNWIEILYDHSGKWNTSNTYLSKINDVIRNGTSRIMRLKPEIKWVHEARGRGLFVLYHELMADEDDENTEDSGWDETEDEDDEDEDVDDGDDEEYEEEDELDGLYTELPKKKDVFEIAERKGSINVDALKHFLMQPRFDKAYFKKNILKLHPDRHYGEEKKYTELTKKFMRSSDIAKNFFNVVAYLTKIRQINQMTNLARVSTIIVDVNSDGYYVDVQLKSIKHTETRELATKIENTPFI